MSGVIVVFAKRPRAGSVKTRLTPPLDPAEAAALYECMLDDVLALTARAAPALGLDPVLAVHPPEAIGELAQRAPRAFRVIGQHGHDLAERMAWAVDEAAAGGAAPILLRGSDSPALSPSLLRAAVDTLREHDVVLCPDRDGGYNLVGVRRPARGLFAHAMSTASVLDDTLARARALGLLAHVLPACFDVDTAADLLRLETVRADASELCPRTFDALDRLPPGRYSGAARRSR